LSEFLHNAGYTNLVTFENPIDAIDAMEDFHDFAFVISDYSMPDINGFELLGRLTANNPALYGIVITADPGSVPQQRVYPVLEKGPGLFTELLQLLSSCTVEYKVASV
jgi:CheY-like chemotaxis protein